MTTFILSTLVLVCSDPRWLACHFPCHLQSLVKVQFWMEALRRTFPVKAINHQLWRTDDALMGKPAPTERMLYICSLYSVSQVLWGSYCRLQLTNEEPEAQGKLPALAASKNSVVFSWTVPYLKGTPRAPKGLFQAWVPQSCWNEPWEIYSLTLQECRHLWPECQEGWFLLRTAGNACFSLTFRWLPPPHMCHSAVTRHSHGHLMRTAAMLEWPQIQSCVISFWEKEVFLR